VTRTGGHTEDQARDIIASPAWWERWQRFEARGEVEKWANEWGQPELRLPTQQEAIDALFAFEPLVFSRLADFQDVTMRLIGERLVGGFEHRYDNSYNQIVYVQDELATRVKAKEMKVELYHGRRFHLCCSEHNSGTVKVAKDTSVAAPWLPFSPATDVSQS
jgi:hypothetical protein